MYTAYKTFSVILFREQRTGLHCGSRECTAVLRYCGIINFPDDSQALSSVGANGVASTPFSSAIFTRLMNLWTRSTTPSATSLRVSALPPRKLVHHWPKYDTAKRWITKSPVNWQTTYQITEPPDDWCTTELQHPRRYTFHLIKLREEELWYHWPNNKTAKTNSIINHYCG